MPLEYVALFVELLEITKKITVNTIEDHQKQSLSHITDRILKDIGYVLNYCSEQEYSINEAKKLMILSMLGNHQESLNTLIEQLAVTKVCSKCETVYIASPRHFYKDHRAKDGLRNDCILCHKNTQRDLYHNQKSIRKEELQSEEEISRRKYENIMHE